MDGKKESETFRCFAGIEPNDHTIYLDVKQYLGKQNTRNQ